MATSDSNSSSLLALAQEAADGDDSAFGRLFEQFRPHLRQFIDLRLDQRVKRRVAPSDVLQETQMEVHKRLADFLKRRPMPIRVWMRRTAFEQVIRAHEMHLKADRRTVKREARFSQQSSLILAQHIGSADPTPSQNAVEKERLLVVSQAISKLENPDSEILILRNVEGLSFKEIACTLDISEATGRKRFGRALMKLQKLVQSFGRGDLFE